MLTAGVGVAVGGGGHRIRRESLPKGGVIVAIEDGAVGGGDGADRAQAVLGVIRGLSGG